MLVGLLAVSRERFALTCEDPWDLQPIIAGGYSRTTLRILFDYLNT